MLPYTGTYAQLGTAITNGFKLAVNERGGKLGGRELEYFTVDDEAEPSKAPENTNKLVQRDKVDVLVGTVHSGVQMGMVKIAKETNTLMIIPNAGLDAATGALCAPNIFRTSFSNWQPSYPMGKVLADRGIRNVVSLAWKYGAGEEAVAGFTEGFIKAGGKSVRGLWIPFPNAEFQALLTEIASHQTRCGLRIFCRRRRREIRQGLRRRGIAENHSAVWLGLSHRRRLGRDPKTLRRAWKRLCTMPMV